LRNQSTPNGDIARLGEKTSIPYPGSFVGLTEVISAVQTALSALRALMKMSLLNPAPDDKSPSNKAKRKNRVCAHRPDRGASATRAE
jgi:hypothetical protein